MAQDESRMLAKAKFRLANGLPLTTGQASLLAGCDAKTFANWIRTGKVDATRTPGGHWLIPAAEVRRVILGAPPQELVTTSV